MCRYTKSGFSKSFSSIQIGTSEGVLSATLKSENQQPSPADEDIVESDLVSPFNETNDKISREQVLSSEIYLLDYPESEPSAFSSREGKCSYFLYNHSEN